MTEPLLPATSLRSLILTERAGLTPTHGRLADFCLANPLAAGTMGIEELASAAGVSNATVNRFTRRIGFDGYAGFRSAAVADIHRLMSPEEKLVAEAEYHRSDMAIVVDSFEASLDDLRQTRDQLDPSAWAAAVSEILAAEQVVFIGFGVAALLADLFADRIAAFCRSQLILDGRGGQERVLRRAMAIGEGDLVVALTLPRYSQATLDHVAQMRSQGARILGITDAETSPLVPLCDIALLTVSQHPLLHASTVSVVAVFDALYALLTARAQDPLQAAELTRRLRPHLHIDPAPADPTAPAASRTFP